MQHSDADNRFWWLSSVLFLIGWVCSFFVHPAVVGLYVVMTFVWLIANKALGLPWYDGFLTPSTKMKSEK